MNEEETPKEKYTIVKVIFVFFCFFMVMFITKETGYFEYKTYTKTKLTEEAILRFEKDIEDGKNVSLNDYITSDEIDYSNTISRAGSNISKTVEVFMNDGLKKALKILSALFYE